MKQTQKMALIVFAEVHKGGEPKFLMSKTLSMGPRTVFT
jgi:hypothetical protein